VLAHEFFQAKGKAAAIKMIQREQKQKHGGIPGTRAKKKARYVRHDMIDSRWVVAAGWAASRFTIEYTSQAWRSPL